MSNAAQAISDRFRDEVKLSELTKACIAAGASIVVSVWLFADGSRLEITTSASGILSFEVRAQ